MFVGRVRAIRYESAILRSAGAALFQLDDVEPPTSITASSAPVGWSAATSALRGTSAPFGLSAEKVISRMRFAPLLSDETTLMSVGAPYAPKRPSEEKTAFVKKALFTSPMALPEGSLATWRKAPSAFELRTSTS